MFRCVKIFFKLTFETLEGLLGDAFLTLLFILRKGSFEREPYYYSYINN